jgi:hypothetical protein
MVFEVSAKPVGTMVLSARPSFAAGRFIVSNTVLRLE